MGKRPSDGGRLPLRRRLLAARPAWAMAGELAATLVSLGEADGQVAGRGGQRRFAPAGVAPPPTRRGGGSRCLCLFQDLPRAVSYQRIIQENQDGGTKVSLWGELGGAPSQWAPLYGRAGVGGVWRAWSAGRRARGPTGVVAAAGGPRHTSRPAPHRAMRSPLPELAHVGPAAAMAPTRPARCRTTHR